MRNRWLSLLTLLSLAGNLLTVSTAVASPAEHTPQATEYAIPAGPSPPSGFCRRRWDTQTPV